MPLVRSNPLAIVLPVLFGSACVDLEESVPIVYEEWCAPNRYDTVACTVDGDTVDIGACGEDQGERIRLLGTAAPETAKPDQEAECYGDEATDYLDRAVTGRRVELKFDVECTDIYERTLAWVFIEVEESEVLARDLEDLGMITAEDEAPYEVLVNELMVRAGYATVFQGEVSQDVRYADRMEAAEIEAEAEQLGLWSDCAGE